jgi:hypothetical protein
MDLRGRTCLPIHRAKRVILPDASKQPAHRKQTQTRVLVLGLVIAVAAICGTARDAAARQATTSPGSIALIRVVITNGKLAIDHGASAARGASAFFTLKNDTNSTARFAILGRVSKPIAPHGRGRLAVFLDRRGAFTVKVKLSSHGTLHETFVVY